MENNELVKVSEEKNKIVNSIKNYQLTVPTADTKTMPGALRKEIREYVRKYVGFLSGELKTLKQLKLELFLNKNSTFIKSKIIKELDKTTKLKEYNKLYSEVLKLNAELNKDERIQVNELGGRYSSTYSAQIDDSFIKNSLRTEFNEIYGKGFEEFGKLIQAFEKRIEEAILFGVITNVYELIVGYNQLEKYLEKLSKLKIQ